MTALASVLSTHREHNSVSTVDTVRGSSEDVGPPLLRPCWHSGQEEKTTARQGQGLPWRLRALEERVLFM